jgi:hypothetical protein
MLLFLSLTRTGFTAIRGLSGVGAQPKVVYTPTRFASLPALHRPFRLQRGQEERALICSADGLFCSAPSIGREPSSGLGELCAPMLGDVDPSRNPRIAPISNVPENFLEGSDAAGPPDYP